MKSRNYFALMLVAICALMCGCAAFQTPSLQSANGGPTTQPQSTAEQVVKAVQEANNVVPTPAQPWVAIGCTVALGILGLISHQNVKGNVNNIASAVTDLTQQVSQITAVAKASPAANSIATTPA